MQWRILSALSLSVALVIGAAVLKTDKPQYISNSLNSVDRTSNLDLENYTPTSVADLRSNPANEVGGALSTTDLVGRQLISDYLSLAGKSAVSEESLTKLGEKYANSIANIENSTKIDPLTLNTTSDTKSDLEKYSREISIIETYRIDKLNMIDENESVVNESLIYETAKNISSIYEDAANSLQKMSVPVSLLTLHTSLINNYLSVASGMKHLSEVEQDSVLSFAGVISAQSSIEAGQGIVRSIVEILTKNNVAI